MNDFMTGLLIVIASSVLQGVFMVPMAYVRKWKWENSWAVFSILAMVVFNWVFARALIPPLGQIFGEVSSSELLIPAVFGALWGIGAICFGLGMAAVGFALGYAIIMGIVLTAGAFIPMAVLHADQIPTPKGLLVVASLAVMVLGIIVFGKAGIRKEKEQGGRSGVITRTSNLPMKIGLIICIVAGVFSSFSNVGYSLSDSLVQLSLAKGAPPNWAGNAVWAVVFSCGAVANLIYCIHLFVRNKSFALFFDVASPRNLVLLAAMSAMWIGSFVLYGLGAGKMGELGTVIGWSIFIALSITLANLVGFAQGEWANTSAKTRRLLAAGLGLLILAIIIIALSNKLRTPVEDQIAWTKSLSSAVTTSA
jgi:L-rhamnose-H+ transport protein